MNHKYLIVSEILVTAAGQKQPPRAVLKKRYSEHMQQIYRKTLMSRCDFNKIPLQLY